MNVQISLGLSLFLFLLGSAAAQNNFLDCPGNDDIIGLLRRCCPSDQLPNNCECFDISSNSDFTNTAFNRPQCPESIGVIFRLFTRENRDNAVPIRAGQQISQDTTFESGKRTIFIAHGFTDNGNTPWMLDMKNALLNEGDFNVILVDWNMGARAPNYFLAAANTRTVGAMTARLIQDLNFFKGVPFSEFHLIGHSLGAHVMGSAGKEIQRLTDSNLGRITGLDPAGLAFESYSANVRIDESDALFVDIIHTNGDTLANGGFGTRFSIGSVDFYPNGGKFQPGCPRSTGGIERLRNLIEDVENIACSHGRAFKYFTNSIAICRYDPPDGNTACTMGYHVSRECSGDYYPTTTDSEPFC